MIPNTNDWEFWVDRGGTFTDCIGRDPQTGRLLVTKVLSSDLSFIAGIRQLLDLHDSEALPRCRIRLGTTLVTNALLERRGTDCCLVTTRGFADALKIGDQTRPELFALNVRSREPLYRAVQEVDTRAAPNGTVLAVEEARTTLRRMRRLHDDGLTSMAIVVVFGQRAPHLEEQLAQLARKAGFQHVSVSHHFSAGPGFVARGDTTILDAYLTPMLQRWLSKLQQELPDCELRFMQSSGGMTSAARLRGPHAIFSGPAAGVVACAHVARATGQSNAIGFDMGGTSTDVCRVAETLEYEYDSVVADVRVHSPTLRVHTVAAGGGSICRVDQGRLTVGPQSAGAAPGPLCYGNPNATALTITDVNLVLGRLAADRFPFPLDVDRARIALSALEREARIAGLALSDDALAEGFLEIANANMSRAIREISVAKGYDIRQHAMVVFGGAGGQHACAVARILGIKRIIFHPLAGVLSAFGMGLADDSWHGEAAVLKPFEPAQLKQLEPAYDRLRRTGLESLGADGFSSDSLVVRHHLELRYVGTDTSLSVTMADPAVMTAEFLSQHKRLFGFARNDRPIEIVLQRVEVRGTRGLPSFHVPQRTAAAILQPLSPRPVRMGRARMAGSWQEQVPIYRREELSTDFTVLGPALILEKTGTIAIDPGFIMKLSADGIIMLESTDVNDALKPRSAPARCTPRQIERQDPIELELVANAIASVAEQMGHVLQRTAMSTNIRDRRDFSCAVFDAMGRLIANAPHVPVHLGAMAETIRILLESQCPLAPSDVYLTNAPNAGGSHLPDVTAIAPVHAQNGERLFFVANRGHHADIGGITPGSMPPFSQTLEDEGVVIPLTRIVHHGELDRAKLVGLLTGGRHPVRDVEQNIADIEAQIAANSLGTASMLALAGEFGSQKIRRHIAALEEDAARRVRMRILALNDGTHHFEDSLDDGTRIRVTLCVRGDQLDIDFAGTGALSESNYNAPRAVTIAAILYVMQSIAPGTLPLNAGCLTPVSVNIPPGSILNPKPGAAVAAGNVETSQRIVDVLLGALGAAAASQGTMNNVTFGDGGFGYYETIAGGAGATSTAPGASGIHTHMTNTRITDAEVLETRYPVRICRFAIRPGSGGPGQHRGGDGLVREFEFLRPLTVSLISGRRSRAPFGLMGGGAAASGANFLNGLSIPGTAQLNVVAGDRLTIATPGGGGWGRERA